MERAAMQKVLGASLTLAAGAELRLLPSLPVGAYDRLHLHIGRLAKGVAGLRARVLFATPVAGGALLADSTIWFEEGPQEREFVWTAPANYNHTGFVMSVPVVAPVLYDVILANTSAHPMDDLFVTLLAQEQ
jgi:hypothetical protein